jgi:hypothetical protein
MRDQREVEERLRAALRARAREFIISPDAWEKTKGRRGDAMTRLRSARGGRLRWMAPLAAAAAVVAIALALLAEHVQSGPAPAGTGMPAGAAAPSSSPTTGLLLPPPSPVPKGLRVPAVCVQTVPAPPVYTVTDVSLASMPAVATNWFQQAPPATGIVRVDMSYRGDQATTYLWFTRPRGRPEALVERTHHLLSTSAAPDPVQWHGNAPAFLTSIPKGQAGLVVRFEGDRLVTYNFGLANARATSATVTAGGAGASLTGLEGPSTPVRAQVISGHGFPYRVWVAAFPATPLYGTVVFQDAAGVAIGTGGADSFPLGTMCVPLAALDYRPPSGDYAYSTGDALPQVASVTAVLPDGSQIRGAFFGPIVQTYYREWEVLFPRKDANVTVTLVFKDAAGRVLGQFATVPGKNPFPPIRR